MNDDRASLNYLEDMLQQAMSIMNSPTGFLYLYDSERQSLHLHLALPDAQAARPELAQSAVQTLQSVRQTSPDGTSVWVYLPLTIYSSLTLGAVGFQLAAQGYDQREEMLLQMIANQTAAGSPALHASTPAQGPVAIATMQQGPSATDPSGPRTRKRARQDGSEADGRVKTHRR